MAPSGLVLASAFTTDRCSSEVPGGVCGGQRVKGSTLPFLILKYCQISLMYKPSFGLIACYAHSSGCIRSGKKDIKDKVVKFPPEGIFDKPLDQG